MESLTRETCGLWHYQSYCANKVGCEVCLVHLRSHSPDELVHWLSALVDNLDHVLDPTNWRVLSRVIEDVVPIFVKESEVVTRLLSCYQGSSLQDWAGYHTYGVKGSRVYLDSYCPGRKWAHKKLRVKGPYCLVIDSYIEYVPRRGVIRGLVYLKGEKSTKCNFLNQDKLCSYIAVCSNHES